MRSGRRFPRAVMLDSRRCLVAGGWLTTGTRTTEVLDLETMEFSEGPMMLVERKALAAIADAAGRVLVLGGNENREPPTTDSTEVLVAAEGRVTRERR